MVLEHLALAFQATCRLWQASFGYLHGDTSNIPKYLISEDDRISALPDDILYAVLSLMTVRDAVKTSMLSKRWRYLCLSMPNINLDLHTVFGLPSVRQVRNSETLIHRCPNYDRAFVGILDQFLKLYLGSKISYFRISFCLEREWFDSISQWIIFAVGRGVEKLDLNFVCNSYSLRENNYNNLYALSLQFLSEASTLKHLHLNGCTLKPDLTTRFDSLTNLYLDCVPLDEVGLQMVLCKSTNLEWLAVRDCTLPVKLCICDHNFSLRLKFCALRCCKGLRDLKLAVKNLTTFEISDMEEIQISFSSVPKLEKVFFNLAYDNSMPYIFSEVAKVLPQLKALSILTCVDWVAKIPASPTAFSNVKRLELFFVQDWQYDLVKIIAPLLRALPVLQKLHVVMPYPEYSERRVDELPGYQHGELKEVQIGGFCGTWNNIEFAIYLLKNAVALERMVIDVHLNLYLGTEFWTDVRTHQGLWSKEKREFICDQLLGKNFSGKTQVIIR